MDLLSVVVPVYNSEKYIGRCVESILAQTYSNLEIILVDDGPSDLSGRVCDGYAEKNKNIIRRKDAAISRPFLFLKISAAMLFAFPKSPFAAFSASSDVFPPRFASAQAFLIRRFW